MSANETPDSPIYNDPDYMAYRELYDRNPEEVYYSERSSAMRRIRDCASGPNGWDAVQTVGTFRCHTLSSHR